MFYFVPVDGVDTDIQGTGLNTAMLTEALRNMLARRIVLIIDACQSGGAVEALSKLGEFKVRVEQQRMRLEDSTTRAHRRLESVYTSLLRPFLSPMPQQSLQQTRVRSR